MNEEQIYINSNIMDIDRDMFLVATAEFLRKIRDIDVHNALDNNGDVTNENFLRFLSAYLTLNRLVANVDFQKVIDSYEQSEYMKLISK